MEDLEEELAPLVKSPPPPRSSPPPIDYPINLNVHLYVNTKLMTTLVVDTSLTRQTISFIAIHAALNDNIYRELGTLDVSLEAVKI
jgi:hypothetical protein